jgi:hypothetical protein
VIVGICSLLLLFPFCGVIVVVIVVIHIWYSVEPLLLLVLVDCIVVIPLTR